MKQKEISRLADTIWEKLNSTDISAKLSIKDHLKGYKNGDTMCQVIWIIGERVHEQNDRYNAIYDTIATFTR